MNLHQFNKLFMHLLLFPAQSALQSDWSDLRQQGKQQYNRDPVFYFTEGLFLLL